MKKQYKAAALLVTAVLLVSVGVLQEQNLDVFYKAIRICLECVGIG